MNTNQIKMTRQGVRDLSFIKAPKRHVHNIAEVPQYLLSDCKHPRYKRITLTNNEKECVGCGKMWDGEGNEFEE